MRSVNIISFFNKYGLSNSSYIVYDVLKTSEFKVTRFMIYQTRLERAIAKIVNIKQFLNYSYFKNQLYDVNIFMERIEPQFIPLARINCLIPNQEWIRKEDIAYLGEIDLILCKTRYAEQIFKNLGYQAEFTSFTSRDRYQEYSGKNYNDFLHLAGRSNQKGTKLLVKVWESYPEWPRLTIIQNQATPIKTIALNIDYVQGYLKDKHLKDYQNQYGIHLCPSEAEGFGHYIVEGMSCQAVILTTNAPPMNELIEAERGILVNYQRTQPQGLGTNYYIDESLLAEKIKQIMGIEEKAKKKLGQNARDWYKYNDRLFKQKLIEVMRNI